MIPHGPLAPLSWLLLAAAAVTALIGVYGAITRRHARRALRADISAMITAAECGHELILGDVAYACERTPHQIDGYGYRFRHAARIDEQHARDTDEGDGFGRASLITWGEDAYGDAQDWEAAWGTLAGLDTRGAAS
jgi:hypothetical protein